MPPPKVVVSAPSPTQPRNVIVRPSQQRLLDVVQVMSDFMSSSDFGSTNRLLADNEELHCSVTATEEQTKKRQNDLEQICSDYALAV